MPNCYMCVPTCENCRPKTVVCTSCGLKTLIDLERCPKCQALITQEMRDASYAEWLKTHSTRDETTN